MPHAIVESQIGTQYRIEPAAAGGFSVSGGDEAINRAVAFRVGDAYADDYLPADGGGMAFVARVAAKLIGGKVVSVDEGRADPPGTVY